MVKDNVIEDFTACFFKKASHRPKVCPNCKSDDVAPTGATEGATACCRDCGHEWEEIDRRTDG